MQRRSIFSLIIVCLSLLGSFSAKASTLVISDIDDTIKLADIPQLIQSARYALDEHSAFLGMNHLFQKLKQDNGGARMVYLSKAPEWLMKKQHLEFLRNNSFPGGEYWGRTHYSASEHKLKVMRELLSRYQPTKVILIGDNGEQDAQNYEQIVRENRGIEFHQYIHIVYSNRSGIYPDQTGFVTAIELAVDLSQQNFLSSGSVQEILDQDLSQVLKEVPGQKKGQLAFPQFMDCRGILWQWDIPGLNKKIQSVCYR